MASKNIGEKMDGATRNLESDNVSALAAAFPEVVADGRVDFEKLRLILGEDIDDSEERYSFNWPGKRDAIKMAISRTTGTLRPDKANSKDWDTTQNMFIEGDNLEVLRSLQNSYRGKVKMIYIDPPYNTGKDFVYKDDFKDNIRNYKENASLEGQSNPETAGRYHTNWLNMMYPRLRLAKNLLKDDGVIFISIDDHEVHNLRKICDEIFGESNLMGHIHWRRRSNQPNDATKMIGLVAEHVLVYAKSKTNYTISGVGKIKLTGTFTNPDNDPRGEWASKPWKTGSSQSGTRYLVTTPNGIQLDEEWMGDSDNYEKLLADNRIYFPDNGNGSPRKKYFKKEREAEGQSASNWWPHTESGSNQDASKELKKLFDTDKVLFTNPKPTELINRCLELANMDNGDIALDFFLGSGTTAEAVQKYNAETGKRIRFIGVQIPEDLNPDTVSGDQKLKAIIKNARDFLLTLNKPANIFELARERILRSSSIYSSYDSGFKVFKLDTTNFREWDTDTADIEQSLLDALNTFKEGRNEEDALYEVLLKYGVDITEPVEELTLAGKKVYSLAGNYLLVCLEKDITLDTVEAMAALKPERVVCYDDGFADEDVKQNSLETLKRAGVTDVRVV